MNLFDNRYKKEDLIGRGAFSEVWRATDTYTNAVMALKIYTSSSQIDDDGLEMLKHEFALMIDADHQNLLRPLHFGVSAEGRLPYLTLPYCKGGNINQTWCSFSPTSGSNDGSVTVSVGENSSTVERMATITVKSEAGDQTVKVTQSGVSPTLTTIWSLRQAAAARYSVSSLTRLGPCRAMGTGAVSVRHLAAMKAA